MKYQYNDYEKPYRRLTTKQYNMETKKKHNWLKIWQIIRDILVGILAAESVTDKL